jgi:F-type H+-transporting ATPase subunit a
MRVNRLKSLLVACLGLFSVLFFTSTMANENKEERLDPAKLIMEHIQDAHDFHFFTLSKADGTEFHATLPLPRGSQFFLLRAFIMGTKHTMDTN